MVGLPPSTMPRGELHRLRHALDARATHAHTYKQTQTSARERAHTHKGIALFHIVLTSIMIHSLKSVGQDGITARHLAPFNVTKRMCRAAPRSHRRNWMIHAACRACLSSWKSKTPSMHRQPYSPRCPWPSAGSIWCWGRNHYSQLGNGNSINQSSPALIEKLTNIVDISLGPLCSCAIDNTGIG